MKRARTIYINTGVKIWYISQHLPSIFAAKPRSEVNFKTERFTESLFSSPGIVSTSDIMHFNPLLLLSLYVEPPKKFLKFYYRDRR